MAIEKVYRCDLDGELTTKDAIRRVGVRLTEDRPDNADWLDIGPCCYSRPIGDLIIKAAERRKAIEDGE
jgi:hypothetical protein